MLLSIVLLSLFHLSESVPGNFACSRKIKVSDAVMGTTFQTSSAVSILLGSAPCNSVLQAGTAYLTSFVNSTSGKYLIDLTNDAGEAFPGASFGDGSHLYNGNTLKLDAQSVIGNFTAWSLRTSSRLNAGTAQNCSARSSAIGKSVIFNSVGKVTVRIAWSTGPSAVFVSNPCTYTIVASQPSTTPVQGSGSNILTPMAFWTKFCIMMLTLLALQ